MDVFLIKLVLSFVVGGGYIALTLWASEHFGPKLGGVLTGLPSTMLISLLFIAWTQNDAAAVLASSVMPITISTCALFLVAFVHLARRGITLALVGSLAFWFFITVPFGVWRVAYMPVAIALGLAGIIFSIWMLKDAPDKRVQTHMTAPLFLFRAATAGLVVAAAVLLGKMLGPVWGGIAGGFPAAFSSTMVLLTRKHGPEFAASVAKIAPYGNIASIVFLAGFYYLVPPLGLWTGTLVAYLGSLLTAAAIYKTVLEKK